MRIAMTASSFARALAEANIDEAGIVAGGAVADGDSSSRAP